MPAPGTLRPLEEVLLGFDVRERFLTPERTWDAARRTTHLLRDDAPKPLSVDLAVWPSVFGDGLPGPERQLLQLDSLALPPPLPHRGAGTRVQRPD